MQRDDENTAASPALPAAPEPPALMDADPAGKGGKAESKVEVDGGLPSKSSVAVAKKEASKCLGVKVVKKLLACSPEVKAHIRLLLGQE